MQSRDNIKFVKLASLGLSPLCPNAAIRNVIKISIGVSDSPSVPD